jgi:hypothetical protein
MEGYNNYEHMNSQPTTPDVRMVVVFHPKEQNDLHIISPR